ncbi:MAG: hypothetical protein FJ403_13725 [Verrucomicrobia bacterium]|nr:hypothetical protein [Verrucomicrobiota bacterium]
MPQKYAVFPRFEAAALYRSLRWPERDQLERFLDALQSYPFIEGETTERDAAGRTVAVKFLGKFKIVYWADHSVKEIKVLRLERLSRK